MTDKPTPTTDLPEALTVAVDCWFAKNTGLGGCSDKDVRELADIFRLHALAAGQATAAAQSGAKLNYSVLYVYASQHGIDYNSLCAAVQEASAQPAAQQPHRSGCTAGTDEECVQRGCGTNCPAVSPQADSVQEDAARLDWLESTKQRGHYCGVFSGKLLTRESIDAARAAQKEGTP